MKNVFRAAAIALLLAPCHALAQSSTSLANFTAANALTGTEFFWGEQPGNNTSPTGPDVKITLAQIVTYLQSQGIGAVTSVGLGFTTPAGNILSQTGSPITGAGSFTIGLQNQNANCVIAGPSSGSATAPTCRGLVSADMPATVPETNAANVFSAPQSTTPVALTSAATVNVPLGSTGSNSFTLGLTGNVTTLANPTGNIAGTYFCIRIKQPASGGPYTISGYGTYWQFPGGTAPVLSTGANAVDILCAWGATSTEVDAALQNAFAP